jgi:hypothetical protein
MIRVGDVVIYRTIHGEDLPAMVIQTTWTDSPSIGDRADLEVFGVRPEKGLANWIHSPDGTVAGYGEGGATMDIHLLGPCGARYVRAKFSKDHAVNTFWER